MDRFQMNGSVAYNFFKDLLGIGGYFVLFHNEDKYLLNGADGMQFNEKKRLITVRFIYWIAFIIMLTLAQAF